MFFVCSLRVIARRSVSRVLSRRAFAAEMAIHLGRSLPNASRDRPERRRGRPARQRPQVVIRGRRLPLLLGLAPGGVCPAAAVAGGAVRSYRTISPLPPMPSHEAIPGTTGLGGMFLWHFPWGRPRRALPGTVPPWSPDFPPSRRPQGRQESGHPTVWHGTIWDALRLLQTGPANRERGGPDRIPRRIGTTMRLPQICCRYGVKPGPESAAFACTSSDARMARPRSMRR